jgi:hypothetical protein
MARQRPPAAGREQLLDQITSKVRMPEGPLVKGCASADTARDLSTAQQARCGTCAARRPPPGTELDGGRIGEDESVEANSSRRICREFAHPYEAVILSTAPSLPCDTARDGLAMTH